MKKKLLELFTKKNWKKKQKTKQQNKCKTNEKEYRIEKVINRKSNKLYVKFIF